MVRNSILVTLAIGGIVLIGSALMGPNEKVQLAYDCIDKSENEYEYMVCTGREYAYHGA